MEGIIEQFERENLPLPKKYQDIPELLSGLEFFYEAFFDLTTCRDIGSYSEGPIRWTDIYTWALAHNIDDEQREDLFFHIRGMDNAYLKYRADKTKAEMNKGRLRGKV